MHRVALESIREIVIDRDSKIFVRLGRKTESFFSSNQDFVGGNLSKTLVYRWYIFAKEAV